MRSSVDGTRNIIRKGCRTYGAPALPTTSCSHRRYLDPDGGSGQAQPMPQAFTSWEAIYTTLRAAFTADRYHMGAALNDARPRDEGVEVVIEGHGEVDIGLVSPFFAFAACLVLHNVLSGHEETPLYAPTCVRKQALSCATCALRYAHPC